jgi:hypothetical protein
VSETRVIPESLGVHVLHELCTGPIAVRGGIVRVKPRVMSDRADVDLFLAVETGIGMMDLHVILPPRQAGQVIDMLQEALMLIGGRDA